MTARGSTRPVTMVVAGFLALQGSSTLAALTWPAVDRAVPALLDTTEMVVAHSTLHLLTAALGFVALWSARPRWFCVGFGAGYTTLAVVGAGSGRELHLGLQPFDHPFHLVLGGLCLGAAALEWRAGRRTDRTEGAHAAGT